MSEPSSVRYFGVPLALLLGMFAWACRAGEGDRCVCGDDCRSGLVCVADGRILEGDECNAVVGPAASPGECVDEQEAGLGDGDGGSPEIFMDLGSKRDFEPGLPPTPDTDTDSSSATGSSSGDTDMSTSTGEGDSSSGGSSSEGGSTSSSGGSSSGGSSSSSGGSSSGGSSSSGGTAADM